MYLLGKAKTIDRADQSNSVCSTLLSKIRLSNRELDTGTQLVSRAQEAIQCLPFALTRALKKAPQGIRR